MLKKTKITVKLSCEPSTFFAFCFAYISFEKLLMNISHKEKNTIGKYIKSLAFDVLHSGPSDGYLNKNTVVAI